MGPGINKHGFCVLFYLNSHGGLMNFPEIMMMKILMVGMGGFAGSICRYMISGLSHRLFNDPFFPYGTLMVNVVGCLLIGLTGWIIWIKTTLHPWNSCIDSRWIPGRIHNFFNLWIWNLHLCPGRTACLGTDKPPASPYPWFLVVSGSGFPCLNYYKGGYGYGSSGKRAFTQNLYRRKW